MNNIILSETKVIDLYQSGKSLLDISIVFKCSTTPIIKILSKNNISFRKRGSSIKYKDINTNLFKEINDETSAYFLGLLYSDGCVYMKNNSSIVRIELKADDQIILQKFRDIISPTSPVKITKRNTVVFSLSQKIIAEQLISLGCLQKKSFTLRFPAHIPDHLLHHFLRGYSDGDGCICKSLQNNKYVYFSWDIISTKQFCEQVSLLLKNKLDIESYVRLCKPKTNKITSRLSIRSNNQVDKILSWLYRDATIYLPRKYEKYLDLHNNYSKVIKGI